HRGPGQGRTEPFVDRSGTEGCHPRHLREGGASAGAVMVDPEDQDGLGRSFARDLGKGERCDRATVLQAGVGNDGRADASSRRSVTGRKLPRSALGKKTSFDLPGELCARARVELSGDGRWSSLHPPTSRRPTARRPLRGPPIPRAGCGRKGGTGSPPRNAE